tara:strand:+ start:132 stop:551 length:420 start_codon:yes stop_codon:yes gene_type:complete
MATLTANKILDSGFSSSMATCTSAGDEFSNTGVEFIRIQNGHASVAYTVKIVAATTTVKHPSYGNLTKSDIYKSVSSSGSTNSNDIILGPFKQGAFNDVNNKVQISYCATAVATAAAFASASAISGSHLLKIEVLYLDN